MREHSNANGKTVAEKNARTGWVLAAIAAFFFVAVFVKHIWFS